MADEAHQNHSSSHCHRRHGHHFLLVAYGIQSHVNPGRVLAHRLARLDVDGPILATLSLPVFAHRRMFPSSDGEETTDGVISYVPYSDGLDDGTTPRDAEERGRSRAASFESLSATVAGLAARGQPVTCIICIMMFPSLLDVAREHAIPLAVYWIQPATVLAAHYHYFHGYDELIAAHTSDPVYEVSLPGLRRPLRIRDFPSFLVDTTGNELVKVVNQAFQELFDHMDQAKTKVLVNTFDELEAAALTAMRKHLDVYAVGPLVGSSAEARIHLFKHDDDDENRYMEWLGAQPERSVVYVSFGSIWTYSEQQMEEMVRGLRQCRRPHLLVVRKDERQEDVSHCLADVQGHGMVVEWCDQLEVLSHPSVGCFVTHCGWNSTLEAMALGVPIVAVANWFDQPTNACLVEEWLVGVRGERNREGVFDGVELARCIESVMGEGENAMAIRERVKSLKGMVQEVAALGGPADRSLRSFVTAVASDTVCMENTTQHVKIHVVQE